MIFSSLFLGFSSWKNSCSVQQMLFHCEYMKLIGELLTMWTMWTIRTVKCEDRLHIYWCYCWLWFRLYCLSLSLMPSGLGKNTTQLKKFPHVLYFMWWNKVYHPKVNQVSLACHHRSVQCLWLYKEWIINVLYLGNSPYTAMRLKFSAVRAKGRRAMQQGTPVTRLRMESWNKVHNSVCLLKSWS